jgi:hypothetical protein
MGNNLSHSDFAQDEGIPFYLPFNVTYFLPIFGLPSHIKSFVYSADYMTTSKNFFGAHLLSQFHQNVSKSSSNDELVKKYDKDYYRVDDGVLIRGYTTTGTNPIPSHSYAPFAYDFGTIDLPSLICKKIFIKMGQNLDLNLKVGKDLDTLNESNFENKNHARVPFLLMSFDQGFNGMLDTKGCVVVSLDANKDILPFHGIKAGSLPLLPKYTNKPYFDDHGENYFFDKNHNNIPLLDNEIIPALNPPPPTCFQIIPTIEYNYERLLLLRSIDRIPAHHIATVLILDLISVTARVILSNFITKTAQNLSKNSIFPLTNVPIHVILLNEHIIDQQVINRHYISDLLVKMNFNADFIYFHGIPLFQPYISDQTATLTTNHLLSTGLNKRAFITVPFVNGHKVLDPVSPLTEERFLAPILDSLWDLIYTKHFELHQLRYFKRINNDNYNLNLIHGGVWPVNNFVARFVLQEGWPYLPIVQKSGSKNYSYDDDDPYPVSQSSEKWHLGEIYLSQLLKPEQSMLDGLPVHKKYYKYDSQCILQQEILKAYKNWLLSPNGKNGQPIFPQHFDNRHFSNIFSHFPSHFFKFSQNFDQFSPHQQQYLHISNPRPIQFPDSFDENIHNNGLKLPDEYTALYLPLSGQNEEIQYQKYEPILLPPGILPRKYEFDAFIMTGPLLFSHQHPWHNSRFPKLQNCEKIWKSKQDVSNIDTYSPNTMISKLNLVDETHNGEEIRNKEIAKETPQNTSTTKINKESNAILQPIVDSTIIFQYSRVMANLETANLFFALKNRIFPFFMVQLFGTHKPYTPANGDTPTYQTKPQIYPFLQKLHHNSNPITHCNFRSNFFHQIENEQILNKLEKFKNDNFFDQNGENTKINKENEIEINMTYLIRPVGGNGQHYPNQHHIQGRPYRLDNDFGNYKDLATKYEFDCPYYGPNMGKSISFCPKSYLYGVIILPFIYVNNASRNLHNFDQNDSLYFLPKNEQEKWLHRSDHDDDDENDNNCRINDFEAKSITGNLSSHENLQDGVINNEDTHPTQYKYPNGFIPPLIPPLSGPNWSNSSHTIDLDVNEMANKQIRDAFPLFNPDIASGPFNAYCHGYSIAHLDAPIHFVVLCLNPVQGEDNDDGSGADLGGGLGKEMNGNGGSVHSGPANSASASGGVDGVGGEKEQTLEPMTLHQFNYIKENGPVIWKRQALTNLYNPLHFVSTEKLDFFFNFHFVQINDFTERVRQIENDAINFQMEIFNQDIQKSM